MLGAELDKAKGLLSRQPHRDNRNAWEARVYQPSHCHGLVDEFGEQGLNTRHADWEVADIKAPRDLPLFEQRGVRLRA